MSEQEMNFPTGNLKISREVIATIAKTATMEIEGVEGFATFATNMKSVLTRQQPPKAVVIELSDDIATIHMNIIVRAGVKIPDIATNVQMAVKEAVQNMTGIAVSRVNVTIAGIQFAEPVSNAAE